jgi:hypothetical protein
LRVEKGFSGIKVQMTHVKLAKHRKQWPIFKPPDYRGNITVYDVFATHEDPKRDKMT